VQPEITESASGEGAANGQSSAGSPIDASRIRQIYDIVDDSRRNYCITETYEELSARMRPLVGPSGSWVTFSTWSSRTIGYFIRGDVDPLLEHRLQRLPRLVRPAVRPFAVWGNRLLSRVRKQAGPRLLARGNREIFADIAPEFVRFIDAFAGATGPDPDAWARHRAGISAEPATDVFPAADLELMRDGFAAYYAARFETEPRRRAELVLLGNILLADYEQQRVDPIVRSALSLFPSRLLNDDPDDPELLTVRDAKPWALQDKGRLRTWIDDTYAFLVTRFRMALVLPDGRDLARSSELIRVGLGLPEPGPEQSLYAARLHTLRDSALIAAWNAHDRSDGARRGTRARRWTHLEDRMNCIVNVFRARQERAALFEAAPLDVNELNIAALPSDPE